MFRSRTLVTSVVDPGRELEALPGISPLRRQPVYHHATGCIYQTIRLEIYLEKKPLWANSRRGFSYKKLNGFSFSFPP